jgi:hypothetical protein
MLAGAFSNLVKV